MGAMLRLGKFEGAMANERVEGASVGDTFGCSLVGDSIAVREVSGVFVEGGSVGDADVDSLVGPCDGSIVN